MRFGVPSAVKMSIVVFWVVTPCDYVVVTNVSEERVASIFRVEVDNGF
jgi:predicted Holliday junction resolvase-like endonuclease